MDYKYKAAPKEDTYKLIEKAQKGDARAVEEIVSQNIGLVKKIALKYTSAYYEIEDLMQVGFVGLIKAIDRFDINYDVMFSTYAVPMILGEIKRFLRDDGKIKISRQLKIEMRTLKNIQQEYYNKHGISPKVSYLAGKMSTTKEHIGEILEAAEVMSNIESLDNNFMPKGMRGDLCVDDEEINVSLMDLRCAIEKLPDREKQIIVLRYYKDMTQQQIAKIMGISQVQVSRIEKKVISEIRNEINI